MLSATSAELVRCLWKRLPPAVLTVGRDAVVASDFLAGRATP